MSGILPTEVWQLLENHRQCPVFTPAIAKIGG